MQDVGKEFTDFLKAYNPDDFYKLGNPLISSADIDAIFDRNQANFDAWRKIPIDYKDAYGRVNPPCLIEQAKSDPNFTEEDAKRAKEEHDRHHNFYSPVPKDLEEHPIYHGLFERGMKVTPAHIAAMTLLANELQRTGYSYKTSEKVSHEFVLRKVLFLERQKIMNDVSLSLADRNDRLCFIDLGIKQTRLSEDKLKKDDAAINRPERMLMHFLRDVQRGKIDSQEALVQADLYVKQIISTGRMSCLQEEMGKSLYQKVLKDEQKQILEQALSHNRKFSPNEQSNAGVVKEAPQTDLELNLIAMNRRIYQR
ncbi:MAG: hypothetical protein IJ870_06105 [Alphaproteobacteria bacterium]|nr:hypothetical protein [Alphaproteobacteria bacterium]